MGYAVFCYAVGFVSLLYWIASTGNLFYDTHIDGNPVTPLGEALLKNLALVLIFAVQHSAMARSDFKQWITRWIPPYLERSTYVLATGIALTFLVWQWEPIGGRVWEISSYSVWYYVLYGLYFLGWIILFVSTFLIDHFDLFGLRQAYLRVTGKPYTEVEFKVKGLYKYSRHPLYLGTLMGIWCTPYMSYTHLVFAILLTGYILVGVSLEERDLVTQFGTRYLDYKKSTPQIFPGLRKRRNTQ